LGKRPNHSSFFFPIIPHFIAVRHKNAIIIPIIWSILQPFVILQRQTAETAERKKKWA
jgi:hypothetical protein